MLNQSEFIVIQNNAINMISIYVFLGLMLLIKVIENAICIYNNHIRIQILLKYKEELQINKRQYFKRKHQKNAIT